MQMLLYWYSSGYSDDMPFIFKSISNFQFLVLVPGIFLQVLWVIIVSVKFLSLKVHYSC